MTKIQRSEAVLSASVQPEAGRAAAQPTSSTAAETTLTASDVLEAEVKSLRKVIYGLPPPSYGKGESFREMSPKATALYRARLQEKPTLETLIARADPSSVKSGASILQSLNSMPADPLNTFIQEMAPRNIYPFSETHPAALEDLVKHLAENAPAEGFEGAAPFIEALTPASRKAFFNTALTQLDGNELHALTRVTGNEGMKLLAVGHAQVTPTLLTEEPGANVTQRVKDIYTEGATQVPKGAEEATFLFGRGLFGNAIPGYFNVNQKAVESWVSSPEQSRLLEYDTAAGASPNADQIYQQVVEASEKGKPVILVGHSKFGIDMRKAFTQHPDMKEKVTGVLLIQPVSTALVMNNIGEHPLAGPAARNLSGMLFGTPDAVKDLGAFENQEPWPGDEVPTVVLSSSSGVLSPLAGINHLLDADGVSSDGALSLGEQIGFAGADFAVLPNAGDHMQLVFEPLQALGPLQPPPVIVDPARLTRAAITTLFERVEQSE